MNTTSRTSDYPIDPMFLERWSPRAFTGEPIPEQELFTVLEAARWAPSAFNSQPWRFIYARRETEPWSRIFDLLVDFNKSWVSSAAAIVIVVSKTSHRSAGSEKDTPLYSHSFDAGAAWMCLALQAAKSGWVAHAMSGFDAQRAASDLGIPADCRVEAAIAIGRQGDAASLPEKLRGREHPSQRLPLPDLLFEGRFKQTR